MSTRRPPNLTTKTINPYLRASVQLPIFFPLNLLILMSLIFSLKSIATGQLDTKTIIFYKEYNDGCLPTLFVKSTMQLERRLGEGILHRKKAFPFPYLFFAMCFIQNKAPRIFFLLIYIYPGDTPLYGLY